MDFEQLRGILTSVHVACRTPCDIRYIGEKWTGCSADKGCKDWGWMEMNDSQTERPLCEGLNLTTLARLVSPRTWTLADPGFVTRTDDRLVVWFGVSRQERVEFGNGYVRLKIGSDSGLGDQSIEREESH
jgi:hypothetical protein